MKQLLLCSFLLLLPLLATFAQDDELIFYKKGEEFIKCNICQHYQSPTPKQFEYYNAFKSPIGTYTCANGKKHGKAIFIEYITDDYNNEFTITIHTNYKNNLLNGDYISYYDSKNIYQKGFYKDDLAQGNITFYYESGAIEQKVFYKDDLKHGELVEYYESGNISYIGFYQNDLKHGLFMAYDESGNIEERQYYQNDELTEEITEYENLTNSTNNEIIIKRYPSGMIKEKLIIDENLTNNEYYFYDESGIIKEKLIMDEKSNQHEYFIYDESGMIKDKIIFNSEAPLEYIAYKDNGTIQEKMDKEDLAFIINFFDNLWTIIGTTTAILLTILIIYLIYRKLKQE